MNRAGREESHPGGKALNVAGALAAAGHRVAVSGLLGRDNAAPFEAFMERTGIVDRFIRTPGTTRSAIKIFDPESGLTTEINFPGNPADPVAVDDLEKILNHLDARWFVLSGSLPPGLEPGFYRRWIARLRGRGLRVALDTSGEPLRHALEAGALPDLIKPNLDELAGWLGEAPRDVGAVTRASREIAARGLGLVVVSMGADGAVFVRGNQAVHGQPPSLSVRSAVGAGDAMMAGLVSAALQGLSLEATARMATLFAAQTLARRAGAPDPAGFDVRIETVPS